MEKEQYLNTMTEHYIVAALWSSTMDDDTPFEDRYSIEQIDPEAEIRCRNDCKKYLELAGEKINDWTPDQAGHDFWLSRNGHGAGFFDRTEIADKETCDFLQDICRQFGERYCYSLGKDTFGIE